MGERRGSGLYQLTVAATDNKDEYLVSHYPEAQPSTKVQGLAEVIELMGQFGFAVIAPKPSYIQLPEEVQGVIEAVRRVLFARDRKMLEALDKSTQEIHMIITKCPRL